MVLGRLHGLFPLDANAVHYSKCVKDHIQKTIAEIPLSAPSSDSSLSVLRSHFTFIEECIGDEKALLFRSVHGREWLGDIEDTSLFQLWSCHQAMWLLLLGVLIQPIRPCTA